MINQRKSHTKPRSHEEEEETNLPLRVFAPSRETNSATLTLILTLILIPFSVPVPVSAQWQSYETQIVALVDNSPKGNPIVIEAPFPFVEVSRVLQDSFAQRRRDAAARNQRAIAWFIPQLALKDQLNEKLDRPRSLLVQVEKDKEIPRYEAKDLAAQRGEFMRAYPNLTTITEDDTDTLFSLLDLNRLMKQTGGIRVLGMADLGAESYTICMAASNEGRDLRGGREIETSVACVTQLLLNEKIIMLTVSGPELTSKELRNAMRLTREWIGILRSHNNAPAAPSVPWASALTSPVP